MLRLPIHYNKAKCNHILTYHLLDLISFIVILEVYNEHCIDTFLEDQKYECLKELAS